MILTRYILIICVFAIIPHHITIGLSEHNETQDMAMRILMTGAKANWEHRNNTNQYTINLTTPGFIRRSLYNIKLKNNDISNYHYFKWRAGPPDFTDRPLDFAIDAGGKGFFVVKMPHGIGYTRDGRCRIDQQNQLVLVAGNYPILGEKGPIVLENDRITIASTGMIYDEQGRPVDRLKIAVFKYREQMKSLTTPNGVIFFSDQVMEVVEGPQHYRILHRWLETPNILRSYDSKWAKHAYRVSVETAYRINRTYRSAGTLALPQ